MLVLYEILSKASPELRKALIILGGLIVAGLSKGRDYICLFAGLILILKLHFAHFITVFADCRTSENFLLKLVQFLNF